MKTKELHIMVVDDESGVRRSIIEKLKKVDLQTTVRVTAEAESGEQAYDYLHNKTFDLIILDMRMPGMGGKRFLSLLREEFPLQKVIVLSGYSDFEYVQHSIRSGVIDYLLKPVIREELERSLIKAIKLNDEEEEKKVKENTINSLLNQSLPLLKYQLLNRILQPSFNDSVRQKLRLLQIHFDESIYIMAVAHVRRDTQSDEQLENTLQEQALLFFIFENIVNDTFKEGKPPVCFPHSKYEREFIMIFNFSNNDEKVSLELVEDLVHTLSVSLEQYGKMRLDIILSKPFSLLQEAWVNYEEINQMHTHNSYSAIRMQVAESVNPIFEATIAVREERIIRLITAIEEEDFRTITAWMADVWLSPDEMFESKGKINEKQIAASIYILMKQLIERIFVEQNPFDNSMQRLFELLKQESATDKVRDEFLKIAVEISECASNRNRTDAHQMIRQAKQFIEQHYFENLSLELLSNKFYLNRTYFSELFKKESGWNFKKYVNHIRIEKAKQFLCEQDFRPSVVAELVGIQDPVYFSVLFKKMTGVTPGEYRQTHRQP